MAATAEALDELNAMLDDGVRVEVTDDVDGDFRLRVVLEDASCADCLVPDETLGAIATDALTRRGVTVRSVVIEHA